ncbi:MAG: hypothetical protein ACSHX8_00310 [Opitutaceae bacterium]
MKILKKSAPPELKGHHKKSMFYCLIAAGIGISCILIPAQVFKQEATWMMAIPFFCVPFIFLFIAVFRSSSVACPECERSMKKGKGIEVVEDHEVFGRYPCAPWNIFSCDFCQKQWRVPSIAVVDGHSLSKKDYQEMIEAVGTDNG